MIEGAEGYVELSGAADMVLEVVSKHSVRKDTIKLPEVYWKAGFNEYWLVDARGATPRFDIFRRTGQGYAAMLAVDGWLTSSVFQRRFQLVQQINPLGKPSFIVNHKDIA